MIQAFDYFNITPVNDAPLLIHERLDLTPEGIEDETYVINKFELLSGYKDPENDIISIQNLTVTNGIIVDSDENGYLFKPDSNFFGEVTVNYDISDEYGASIKESKLLMYYLRTISHFLVRKKFLMTEKKINLI